MTVDSTTPPLVLASQSPRRRWLLEQADYEFATILPGPSSECGICSRETPPELVARLAHQKARDVAQKLPQAVVIGCDTLAFCQGQVLGKPSDRQHAQEMLKLLRGQPHKVYSGLCIWQRPQNRQLLDVAVSHLTMDRISDRQLAEYLDSQRWEGKAGAFGYQDGLDWVHLIDGSESNVVGLPLELLETMLEQMFPGVGSRQFQRR